MSQGEIEGHRFGGAHTEVKLDAVQYYLECYSKALKSREMEIWYVDAFAGSGDRESEVQTGGLLEGKPFENILKRLDGSAKRALKVEPAFDKFVFIEMSEEWCDALAKLKKTYPERHIEILKGDANSELNKIFSTQNGW
ncbi:MAG: three-Cys-motif partner protein TcmP [Phyllobacteriaceae bacterium]|nr:three-Cys-motif partner protein TcmP [Phyllobacteriaceae bacterium]